MAFSFLYDAKVVDINDPKGNLNRVKVRVPEVHGEEFPDEFLPWAFIGTRGGGVADAGSADKYEKGADVYVMFENGDPSMPVVLFGVVKQPSEGNSYGDCDWGPEPGSTSDVPVEAQNPRTHTYFKSPKGASVYVIEDDRSERMVQVDRAGQMMEMCAPVTVAANANNGERRGIRIASDDTQLGYSVMSGPAYMRMKDLSGNVALLYSEEGKERIELYNKAHENKLVMNESGVVWDVLGGMTAGGITFTMSSDGVKVNGKYLASESVVDWIKQFEKTFTMGTSPGNPSPVYPAALTDFNVKHNASIDDDGMKTRI